jgi:hypothetical protein
MNSRLRREIADQAAQFAGIRHAVAIDADNYVAGSQPTVAATEPGSTWLTTAPFVVPAWSARREILGQVLRYDAKLSALDFSVRDQFRKNLLRGSRGNSEADAAAR